MSEPSDDEIGESKPWVQTGSNVLPLGVKDEPESLSLPIPSPEAVLSLPARPVIRTTPPNSFVGSLNGTQHVLEYPPESYLPPPGLYYDQYHISAILDDLHFNKKISCRGCGAKKHGTAECKRKCSACGTQSHMNEASDI
jgi:ribosomal protein L40E